MSRREEEIRRALAELQALRELAESMRSRINVVESLINELKATGEAIKAIRDVGENATILVPVGGDSFIRAKVEDMSKVLVGVGAGVVLEKDVEDALNYLGERVAELEKISVDLRKRLAETLERIRESEDRIRRMAGEARAGGGVRKA